MIALYFAVIIAANLIVNKFGQQGLLITATLLIPFDLTARDSLHMRWEHRGLKTKMFFLIATGGILTYLIDRGSAQVAIASSSSFIISGVVDYIAFELLIKRSRALAMNVSNIVSGSLDSIVFPFIAFGAVSGSLSFQQAVLKGIGGLFWVWVLKRWEPQFPKAP